MLNSGWQCPPLNLVTIKFGLRCTKLMLNSKIIQNKQENIPNSVKKYPCQKYKSLQFEPLIQVRIFYQFRWQKWSWDLIFIKVLSFHHHFNVQTIKGSRITFLNNGVPRLQFRRKNLIWTFHKLSEIPTFMPLLCDKVY